KDCAAGMNRRVSVKSAVDHAHRLAGGTGSSAKRGAGQRCVTRKGAVRHGQRPDAYYRTSVAGIVGKRAVIHLQDAVVIDCAAEFALGLSKGEIAEGDVAVHWSTALFTETRRFMPAAQSLP